MSSFGARLGGSGAEVYFLLVSNHLGRAAGQVITVDGPHEAFLR